MQRMAATVVLVISFLVAIECEAVVIHGMWFKPVLHGFPWDKYTNPIFVALPLLISLLPRINAKKWIDSGRVSPTGAAMIRDIFSFSAFVTYMCIDHLARLAF